MIGRRGALIVGCAHYEEPDLQSLPAVAKDAEALAEVLADPDVGGYEVRRVIDQPAHLMARAIDEFFVDREPDDLLLLHLSCHGVKDETGDLYFAAADTRVRLLTSTAVPAAFVNQRMSRTRSRRVVLLLDCCYAGAFEKGLVAKSAGSLDLQERLTGRGRAVITASTAMEYAFVGGRLDERQTVPPSVFTGALVEGLRSGEADRDLDGLVGLDELYEYVYDAVRETTPNQTPSKWELGIQGDLVVAQRGTPVAAGAPLEPELVQAVESPLASIRAGAVAELARVLAGSHPGRRLAAEQALNHLLDDDSLSVRSAAKAALSARQNTGLPAPPPPDPAEPEVPLGTMVSAQPRPASDGATRQEADATAGDESQALARASDESREPAQSLLEGERTPVHVDAVTISPNLDTVVSSDRPAFLPRWRRPLLVGGLTLVVSCALVAAILLQEGPPPDLAPALDRDHALVRADGQVQAVDMRTGDVLAVTAESATQPAVSRDRRTVYVKWGDERDPMLLDADLSNARPLPLPDEACESVDRPSWSEQGDRIAVICAGPTPTVYVGDVVLDEADRMVDVDWSHSLDTDAIQAESLVPKGGPTWLGRDFLVVPAWRDGVDESAPVALFAVPTAVRTTVGPQKIEDDDDGVANPDVHGDTMLYLKGPQSQKEVLTVRLDRSTGQPVEGATSVSRNVRGATWSPYGAEVLVVTAERELTVLAQEGSEGGWASDDGPVGDNPAWGSR